MSEPPDAIVDRDDFEALVARHQRELRLHCYRMLGSLQDAEDAAQETLLRAWNAREGFEGRASARTWLHRIGTNVCLRVLERRRGAGRRVLPRSLGAAVAVEPLGAPALDVDWLEPYPIGPEEVIGDPVAGPEARYEAREAVRLAFAAAIATLPPRQRAALLLQDVLGMSAGETAAALGTSRAATNSALQRARATLRRRDPGDRLAAPALGAQAEAGLLERYVRAWEAADVDGIVSLLADDAAWSMPPWRQWYRGAPAIGAFLTWALRRGPGKDRLVPTFANGQPAFGHYRLSDEGRWLPFALQVTDLEAGRIGAVTAFVRGDLFGAFGLPRELPADR